MPRLGLLLLAASLAACQATDPCNQPVTPIGEVQGNAAASPLVGSEVGVRGVVTRLEPGLGLFIQERYSDSSFETSDGLFVSAPELAESLDTGDLLAVAGTVAELGSGGDTLTTLVDVRAQSVCGNGLETPVIDARLPLDPSEREALEGMKLFLELPVTVTEVYELRRGHVTLSALGLLRAPTEVAAPGEEAGAIARKNADWSLPVRDAALGDLDPYDQVHAGAIVNVVSGVLGHDGNRLRLLAGEPLAPVAMPMPHLPAVPDGAVRVASFNLHNYFNGDGRGGGFPTERGAPSKGAFERQSARIAAAVAEMRPDLLAVMELENDGFEAESAVQSLRAAIADETGFEYAVATPAAGRAGGDAIAVGLLYRPGRLSAEGPAELLTAPPFDDLHRPPLAQLFAHPPSGERLLVVVNHLKSKGSCPESGPNADRGDGQGCWNAARAEAAPAMVGWARQLAAQSGTENLLVLGDLNAYRMEDPIRAIESEGLTELVSRQRGLPQYSYIFNGAAGTLDYAFASESLLRHTADAMIWHINAAFPYSDRPSRPWLRSSDHDPVVVDLRFNQDATSD